MKAPIIAAVLASCHLLAGCGKKAVAPSSTPSTAMSPAQAALTAWQQGDKSDAVSSFVKVDWSLRPVFAPSSVLSKPQPKASEVLAELDSLKKLAGAVAQAGRDAAAKGDAAQARKHFDFLKRCGTALQSPEYARIVQMVGEAFVKMGDVELAKVPQ